MMTFVLTLFLVHSNAVGIGTVPYDTLDLCEKAGKAAMAGSPGLDAASWYTCTRQRLGPSYAVKRPGNR